MITGLRRSAIYVPCDRDKMIANAAGFSADLLLLNLEDGVTFANKDLARKNAAVALRAVDFGSREIVVRVNPVDTETGLRDLSEIAPLRPDGICLPKVENADDVLSADRRLTEIEYLHGVVPGSIRLHAMIESAGGMLLSRDIARASPRMASLIFGSADYVADLRCTPGEDRNELLLALQMIVAGARAGGIDAIDAPCFDLRNMDLLRRECACARRLGFDGKSALHPGQLPVIHAAFEVTPEELAWADRVLAELDSAEVRGRALTTMDGSLIDNPHRVAAERIRRRAELAKK